MVTWLLEKFLPCLYRDNDALKEKYQMMFREDPNITARASFPHTIDTTSLLQTYKVINDPTRRKRNFDLTDQIWMNNTPETIEIEITTTTIKKNKKITKPRQVWTNAETFMTGRKMSKKDTKKANMEENTQTA